MRCAWLVALREYGENAKTKGFWITILAIPLIMYLSFKIPLLLRFKGQPTRTYILADFAGEFERIVEDGVDAANKSQLNVDALPKILKWMSGETPAAKKGAAPKPAFRRVPVPSEVDSTTPESLRVGLRPYLSGVRTLEVDGKPDELFALIILPKGFGDVRRSFEFWCSNVAADELKSAVELCLRRELQRRRFVGEGVDPALVERVMRTQVIVQSRDPKKEVGKEQISAFDRARPWVPVAVAFLFFYVLLIVASMLLNNTVEEKSNRVIEVLLSSVTPEELMAGKLFGIAAIGFTILAVWVSSAVGLLYYMAGSDGSVITLVIRSLFTPSWVCLCLAYFLLGYVLYASIFLAVGAACNTLKDAQNLMGVISIFMFVPMFILTFIPRDPHGTLAVVFSWIPLYTPFVMMCRSAASPPMRDLVGTLVLTAVSAAGMLWLSAKIFRQSILNVGQPPRLLAWAKSVFASPAK